MKVIRNNIIPAKGFKAITLLPYIFVRKGAIYRDTDNRHEHIHGRQQLEMLIVGIVLAVVLWITGCGWWSLLALPLFFYWYGIEYVIKLCYYRNSTTAYKNISFEREAYAHQHELDYLFYRDPFAWFRYIR